MIETPGAKIGQIFKKLPYPPPHTGPQPIFPHDHEPVAMDIIRKVPTRLSCADTHPPTRAHILSHNHPHMHTIPHTPSPQHTVLYKPKVHVHPNTHMYTHSHTPHTAIAIIEL